MMVRIFQFVLSGLALALAFPPAASGQTAAQTNFFEREIRPLFETKCGACHGESAQMAGLQLTTAGGFARGADAGPMLVAGDPENSRLIRAVRYESTIKMPPSGKLADGEITALARWVQEGAPWPGSSTNAELSAAEAGDSTPSLKARKSHWAFQPIQQAVPPKVEDESWIQSPIDRFILAKLEENGIPPAPRADKLTLLRRARYDLHGLPPSQREIDEFLDDESPAAFERLVDRLLASPRYGEKWGRHWLDVARYADSSGLDDDIKLPHTWRYRDYVIEAFNEDVPFDRFIAEQLAGDLLPAEKPGEINRRGIIATGFLAVGPKPLVQQDKIKLKYDVVDEQIDTISKVFLGLTIACARCHDHKFDPISTKDYYSLASIFASVENFEDIEPLVSKVHFEPLVPQEQYEQYLAYKRKKESRESWVSGAIDLAMYRRIAEETGPRLAEYMVAARRVYADGMEAAAVAEASGLETAVLEKWVAYLRPGDTLRLYLEPWRRAAPEEIEAVADGYQQRFLRRGLIEIGKLECWLEEALAAIRSGGKQPQRDKFKASSDRVFAEVVLRGDEMGEGGTQADGPFSIPKEQREDLLDAPSRQLVEELRAQIKELEDGAPPEPDMAYAVREGESVEQHVFIRGSYQNPGEAAPKAFPSVLAGQHPPAIKKGSGRLELARWLASPDHPLTSRVAVNRIWQWHFSKGLVPTPHNFGVTGQAPTHPQLLDYLARRFLGDGWSIKSMHRLIMNSSTYQMNSTVSASAWKSDPSNRLWPRFNRRRLSVEEMRDSMLALDGSLDLTMGGKLTDNLDSYSSESPFFHPDKTKRRTVYLPLYRNRLPPDLTLFDFANSTTSVAERSRSTIAPQGLYLMNSDFVASRARALAEKLLAREELADRARIEQAYWTVLSRPAATQETTRMLGYLAGFPASGDDARHDAWASFCRLLLVSNEYHYVN